MENCSLCGKPIGNSARGNLLDYLFQSNYCNCGKTKSVIQSIQKLVTSKGSSNERVKPAEEEPELPRCAKCGFQVARSQPGSLTGYLFQDLRCRCSDHANSFDAVFPKYLPDKIASADEFVRGSIVGDLYRIERPLGSGGMAQVFLAEHMPLKKMCALKIIHPEEITEVGWLRFKQEAKIVGAVCHANLVKVFDLGIHDGWLPFYVMEFVEGESLAEILARQKTISLKTTTMIFKEVCNGVDFAHRAGIIHRDLKPANIMVARDGAELSVKVLDFGLAKLSTQDRDKQGLTAVGDIFGSPFYMSPEQCLGARIDKRTDLYSIGCSIFECLTGRPPFVGALSANVLHAHEAAEPPALSDVSDQTFTESTEIVIAKLLRKNPVERYQTCLELKADLQKLEQGVAVDPFYVKRQKTALTEDKQARSALDRQQNAPHSFDWRLPAIAGTTLLVAMVAALMFFFPKREIAKQPAGNNQDSTGFSTTFDAANAIRTISASEETNKLKAFKNSRPQPASALDLTPYRGKQVGDYVTYHLPKDISIGKIGDTDEDSPPAKGDFKHKIKEFCFFYPNDNIFLGPYYLSRFAPGDLTGIAFDETAFPNCLVRVVSAWPGFATLKAISAQKTSYIETVDYFDATSLQMFNRCKNIREVTCSEVCLPISKLLKMSWAPGLTYVSLTEHYNPDDLLRLLSSCRQIEELKLVRCSTSQDLPQRLAKMPKLRVLMLKGVQVDDAGLQAICASPSLRILCLDNKSFRAATLQILRNAKHLKELALVNNKAKELQLKKTIEGSLPNLEVQYW